MLEDRMVPSTLFVDLVGNAHYVGSPLVNDTVTLSQQFVPLAPQASSASIHFPPLLADVITDAAENITVTGPGAFRWAGSGTHQVSTIFTIPSLLLDAATGATEHVNLQAFDAPTTVRYIGPGNLFVNVGAGNLLGLQAPLTVNSAFGGSTHLTIDDSADTPRAVTLGPSFIQFSGVKSPISFIGNVSSVDVFGGNSDTFGEQTLSSATPITVHGGPGASTLISGAGINDWFITGINAGSLHNVGFVNVQNLRGGLSSARDTFHFNDKMLVTGSIMGAPKFGYVATLDYSKYTVPLTVDLKLNVAKVGAITTLVGNINDVLGGQGNNILVGNVNNFLRGGAGRDILISGGGVSTLQAGPGEALMIGAHYIFDTVLPALNNLEAVWTLPLPYATRVAMLEAGAITPLTCHFQPGTTTLIHGVQPDFYVVDVLDIIIGLQPTEKVLHV
jgi:Ca2+-binding RTX toxin-like protein